MILNMAVFNIGAQTLNESKTLPFVEMANTATFTAGQMMFLQIQSTLHPP